MIENIEWKCGFMVRSFEYNRYEKISIFYNAKCELFDRTLTDKRDRYDDTCSFLETSSQRNFSNKYAINLIKKIEEWYTRKYNENFDCKLFKEEQQKLNRYKVQYVIDLFEQYIRNQDELMCELNDLFLNENL